MDFLQNLLDSSTQLPFFTALILGLMTAISPCPLATNITAIAFIGKDLNNKRKVFVNGLIYTLGRAISYSGLGLIFYFGASQFHISGFIQKWGEKILAPLLIILGLLMLDAVKIKFPGLGKLKDKMEQKSQSGSFGVLLLGIIFALAFCPYSGVLYFGMLIPITITRASGLYLPLIFALGTGLPVIIFAWFIAYTVGGISEVFNKVKTFEKWFRRTISVIFIGVGVYFLIIYFF